jgi:uncharacterized protein (TIGR02270 family)
MTITHQTSEPRVVIEIVTQHAEEAAFLWAQRTVVAHAPHFRFQDLARLDSRVEANIDGLRIAGEDGWQLCKKELQWKEPGEVFAAAVLALETGDPAKIQSTLAVAVKSPELCGGFVSALGWLEYQRAKPHIQRLYASNSPAEKRIGIAAAAIHRRDPGHPLNEAISDPDALLRARALRAIGELGRIDLVPLIQNEMNGDDVKCRFWSAWSTALLVGYGNAIEVLQSIAESPSPYRERALQMALRRMDPRTAHAWQQRVAQKPQTARLGVVAAGVVGDPAPIPWLMEQMNDAPLARVAGEAFTMITGVDLAYEDLDTDKPEGFESGPTENPEDDNVEMDPDERLPWPDANLIAKWWEKHTNEFQPGVRHLLGKPITMEWMQQVLRIGRQRQRAAAALELAILQSGTPLFEVRAPGFRQQQMLGLSATR